MAIEDCSVISTYMVVLVAIVFVQEGQEQGVPARALVGVCSVSGVDVDECVSVRKQPSSA